MLKAIYHKDFNKDYARLKKATQERYKENYEIFVNDPSDRRLKNHPLSGKMAGRWSFSVTGDVRVVYRFLMPDVIILLRIGSHNQVY